MGTKVLKFLIVLDEGGWKSCQEIAKQLNMTPDDIVAQIRMLKRLEMVEIQSRTTKQGEKVPTAYRSRRCQSNNINRLDRVNH